MGADATPEVHIKEQKVTWKGINFVLRLPDLDINNNGLETEREKRL